MIDVPERVKDALRSGDYRKNYKITVSEIAPAQEIVSEFSLYEYDPTQYSRRDVAVNITTAEDEYYLRTNHPFDELQIIYQYQGESYTEHYFNYTQEGDLYYVKLRVYEPLETATRILIQNDHVASWDEYECDILHKYLAEATIDNNNLVTESVKFDERMCSDTELKFGLCEGTSVEFQYFDFPSILGKHLNIELDVEYKKADGTLDWHTIPMGQFDVAEISRQASTGIIKVTAYNKLMSKYLDSTEYVNNVIQAGESGIIGQTSVYKILNSLLADFTINEEPPTESDLPANTYSVVGGIPDGVTLSEIYRFTKSNNTGYYKVWAADFDYKSSLQGINGYYIYRVYTQAIYQYIKTLLNYGNLHYGSNNYTLAYAAENLYVDIGGDANIKNTSSETIDQVKWFAAQPTYIDLGGHEEREGTTYFTYATNNDRIHFTIPVYVLDAEYQEQPPTPEQIAQMRTNFQTIMNNVALCVIKNLNVSALAKTKITENDVTSGVTLRDLQSAVYEVNCQYGKLDRVTDLFAGIELNNGGLYPRDNLYPADNLYPQGTAEAGYPSMYSKLWADEGNVRSFKFLIITYKTTETIDGQLQEVEKTLQRTVNAGGTDNYNMSDNWLFRNLIWTSAQVGALADEMVIKMRNIRWFPFEMWCAGLPYIEAGDAIEIVMSQGTYKSYILRRTMSGIQNLQDELIDGTLDIF